MAFREQEVQIEGKYPLSGTLTFPKMQKKKYSIVIIIHGSGKVDRDENAKGIKNNAFKELSELAAEEGFAVLRYDKRGIGKSEGKYLETGLEDLIEDAVHAVEFAHLHPEVDSEKVIFLGHSEGALIAPAVHSRLNIQGMILFSGSAEPLGETTAWQRGVIRQDMREVPDFQGFILRLFKLEKKFEAINSQLLEKLNTTDEAVIRFKGKKVNAKWNREHGDFDVRFFLPGVDCPVLAITGTKDVQVKPEQVHVIKEMVSGPCKAYLIQDMTHLLRKN